MMNYNVMTNEEIKSEMRKLGNMLELMNPCDNDWNITYKKYFFLSSIMDERYREENQEQFDAFYEKNIKGKNWREIDDETWGVLLRLAQGYVRLSTTFNRERLVKQSFFFYVFIFLFSKKI